VGQQVLAALGHDPADVDALALRSALTAECVTAALVELELAGQVALMPGGRYQRLK
jgi:DNA processing protein